MIRNTSNPETSIRQILAITFEAVYTTKVDLALGRTIESQLQNRIPVQHALVVHSLYMIDIIAQECRLS